MFSLLKNKRPEIDEILTSVKPDIIIGRETWLSNTISSYEYFPPSDYTVFRKDREQNVKNQSYGGVLIAVSTNLLSEEVKELQSDSEVAWAEINMTNARKLIVGSYYRPPNNTGYALDQLNTSLNRINKNSKSTVILGGNFNLSHINWSMPSTTPGKPDIKSHEQLLDIMNDHSLEQIVTKPTRGDRTLDLISTNSPSSVYTTYWKCRP